MPFQLHRLYSTDSIEWYDDCNDELERMWEELLWPILRYSP